MTRFVCALACLAALAAVAPPVADAHRLTKSPELRVAHQINHFRVAHGRAKLRIAPGLARRARGWSGYLARSNSYGHSRLSLNSGWRTLGEVIAFRWGWRRKIRWPVSAWKRSAGHAAVLLDPRFRAMGVGRARARFGRRPATLWTVQVGSRR